MPRLDNTGPNGNGSMTGRGLGKCNPNSQQTNGGSMGSGSGMGRRNNNAQNGGRQGSGSGRGMGRRCNQNGAGYGANNGQQNNSILSQILAELKHLTNRVLHLEGNK